MVVVGQDHDVRADEVFAKFAPPAPGAARGRNAFETEFFQRLRVLLALDDIDRVFILIRPDRLNDPRQVIERPLYAAKAQVYPLALDNALPERLARIVFEPDIGIEVFAAFALVVVAGFDLVVIPDQIFKVERPLFFARPLRAGGLYIGIDVRILKADRA